MKPAPLDIQTQGSLGGKRIEMTMDMHSLQFAMSTLTNMYSDPIKAIIREYSTNARDAHIAAGKGDVPIEVSTPNSLNPFFKIRDYGDGMSVDFIEKVYSQYWNSTKRDTDFQSGMLGLGSKSGLTYTAQFRIVSIHNGMKIQVMVSKDEFGGGVMEIVDTSMTDEPSGVEIIIPVKYSNEFTNKVNEFFKYWQPGTVLVNDEEPTFIGDYNGAMKIADDIVVLPGQGKSYVIMGSVPYVAEGLASEYGEYHVVAFVPIGSVSFPPNREELMYTEETKATIREFAKRTEDGIAEFVQKEIDAADTYLEAMKIWDKKCSLVNHHYTYRGEALKVRWEYNTKDNSGALVFNHYYERNAVHQPRFISWNEFETNLTVLGWTQEKIPTSIRQKVRQYINNLDYAKRPSKVLFLENHPDRDKLGTIPTVSLDTIKAVKLPKVERSKTIKEFHALNQGGYFAVTAALDDTKEVLYILPGRRKFRWRNLTGLLADFEIVLLKKAELARFKKEYPEAQDLEIWVKDNLGFAKASLTVADKRSMGEIDYYSKRAAERLDPEKIVDPEFAEFVRHVTSGRAYTSDTLKEYNKAAYYATALDIFVEKVQGETMPDPFDKYPLAKYTGERKDHIYIYVEAIFAKEQGNQV